MKRRRLIVSGAVTSLTLASISPLQAASVPPLGPVPLGCVVGPAARMIPSLRGPAAGATPVWAASFHPERPVTVPMDVGLIPTAHGWPVKIPWVERRTYGGVVTIRAWVLPQRQPVWFTSHAQGPRPFLRLDARHPTLYPPVTDPRRPGQVLPNPLWKGFSSIMYIPRAACYEMKASWAGGMWQMRFASGRSD